MKKKSRTSQSNEVTQSAELAIVHLEKLKEVLGRYIDEFLEKQSESTTGTERPADAGTTTDAGPISDFRAEAKRLIRLTFPVRRGRRPRERNRRPRRGGSV